MATARAKYTANQVKLIRAIGGGKRPIKKIPPQLPPIPLEREYAKELLAIIAETRAILADVIAAAPGLLESSNRARGDVRQDAGESTKLRRLMDTARARLRAAMTSKRLEDIARKFGTRTSIAQKAQLTKQIKSALGVSVLQADKVIAPLMEGFIAQNVSLITNLTESMATGVETTIARSIQMGTTTRELAAELDGQFSGGLARAQRIARDQVGSMYGQVNAARQKDLGITRFTWRTVGDDAVRDSHEALADQVFSYDDPPGGILPGQEIFCRCSAEPLLSDLLEE